MKVQPQMNELLVLSSTKTERIDERIKIGSEYQHNRIVY